MKKIVRALFFIFFCFETGGINAVIANRVRQTGLLDAVNLDTDDYDELFGNDPVLGVRRGNRESATSKRETFPLAKTGLCAASVLPLLHLSAYSFCEFSFQVDRGNSGHKALITTALAVYTAYCAASRIEKVFLDQKFEHRCEPMVAASGLALGVHFLKYKGDPFDLWAQHKLATLTLGN